MRSGSSSHSKERGNAKVYKKPSLKEDKPTRRKLVFAEMDDDETPKRAFRAAKLRSVLCLDSPAGDIREKPSELPVQQKQEKQKPTAAKSRPKSNARKPKISDAKKRSPKSSCSPKAKAVISPKSSGSPKKAKKAVVSPKSSGSPKAKAVVSPKSGGSPKKAKAVSPKSGGSPKAKAVVSPKSGCSLVAKLGMKKMAMKKEVKTDKSSMKNLKMTRRNIYSRAYHAIYSKGGAKKKAGGGDMYDFLNRLTSFCKVPQINMHHGWFHFAIVV